MHQILLERAAGADQLFDGIMQHFGSDRCGHDWAVSIAWQLIFCAKDAALHHWIAKLESLPDDPKRWPYRLMDVQDILAFSASSRDERPSLAKLIALSAHPDGHALGARIDEFRRDWERQLKLGDVDYVLAALSKVLGPILELTAKRYDPNAVVNDWGMLSALDLFRSYFDFAPRFPMLTQAFVSEVQESFVSPGADQGKILTGVRLVRHWIGEVHDRSIKEAVEEIGPAAAPLAPLVKAALLTPTNYRE